MMIKTVKDIFEVSNKVLEQIVTKQIMTSFALLVDDGEGNITQCTWTPTSRVEPGQRFLAVGDYATTMIVLLTHPKIKDLQYDEKNQMISAVFFSPEEMQELSSLECPDEEFL